MIVRVRAVTVRNVLGDVDRVYVDVYSQDMCQSWAWRAGTWAPIAWWPPQGDSP